MFSFNPLNSLELSQTLCWLAYAPKALSHPPSLHPLGKYFPSFETRLYHFPCENCSPPEKSPQSSGLPSYPICTAHITPQIAQPFIKAFQTSAIYFSADYLSIADNTLGHKNSKGKKGNKTTAYQLEFVRLSAGAACLRKAFCSARIGISPGSLSTNDAALTSGQRGMAASGEHVD